MASTSHTIAPDLPFWLGPVAWIGRGVIGTLSYLGGLARFGAASAVALVRVRRDEDDSPGFWPAMKAELWWVLVMGFPLVGLVHVAMGSFLSLQAYFGSTFVDGTGAVVGVGLLRNLATMMTGLTLSGLLAGRMIPDLLQMGAIPASDTPARPGQGGRGTRRPGPFDDPPEPADPGRLAAPRIVAAAVAGVLLSLWGALVGTVVGWQSAGTLMGLSSEMFFMMLYRMVWFRDVLGMIVKGSLFGIFIAAICCFEGIRGRGSSPAITTGGVPVATMQAELGRSIVRAACLSMMAILLGNMAWFLLVYHAVPVFGPSLLAPPAP
jgi:phospholipid/cholesterol/gamma-HCH transport system permease protein